MNIIISDKGSATIRTNFGELKFSNKLFVLYLLKHLDKIFENFLQIERVIDLREEDISLVVVADTQLEYSVKSLVNTMSKMIFKEVLFFTSEKSNPCLNKLKGIVEVVKTKPMNTFVNYTKVLFQTVPDKIKTNHILTIQHDGTVINAKAWRKEFLDYDYIGAPWGKHIFKQAPVQPNLVLENYPKHAVGNSGVAIRSKKLFQICKIDSIFNEYLKGLNAYEDCVLCMHPKVRPHLESLGVKYAPFELALEFGYEEDAEGYEFNPDRLFSIHVTNSNFVHKLLDRMDMDKALKLAKRNYS